MPFEQEISTDTPWHQWEFPASAWSRLHIDFAKPLLEKMFIVLVEAHSKQLEVAVVPSCSASSATHFLQKMFATDDLPDQIGTAFSSDEYQAFLKWNIICHTSACKQWSCGTLCANIQGGPQEVKNGHRDPPQPLFANHLTPPPSPPTHTDYHWAFPSRAVIWAEPATTEDNCHKFSPG